MRFSTVLNVLRVLAIVALGYLLFVANVVGTVSIRRALFDLTRDQVEVTAETTREKLRRIQDQECELLEVNGYGIPALVFLALLPYAGRKKSEPGTTQVL